MSLPVLIDAELVLCWYVFTDVLLGELASNKAFVDFLPLLASNLLSWYKRMSFGHTHPVVFFMIMSFPCCLAYTEWKTVCPILVKAQMILMDALCLWMAFSMVCSCISGRSL